jgi:hypothetical protein
MWSWEFRSIFDDWLPPSVVLKEAQKRLDAPRHGVYFASSSNPLELKQIWRIASLLTRAYPEEWVEIRWEGADALLKRNESAPIPLTFFVAGEQLSGLLQRHIAEAQNGVLIWREAGVPEWGAALALTTPDAFGWIGNQHSLQALPHAIHDT